MSSQSTNIDEIWLSLKEECSVGISSKARTKHMTSLFSGIDTSHRDRDLDHHKDKKKKREKGHRRRKHSNKKFTTVTNSNQNLLQAQIVHVHGNVDERVEDTSYKQQDERTVQIVVDNDKIPTCPVVSPSQSESESHRQNDDGTHRCIVVGDSDDETDDDDHDDHEDYDKSTTMDESKRQCDETGRTRTRTRNRINSRHFKLERLVSLLQSSEVNDKLYAIDCLMKQIKASTCNTNTQGSTSETYQHVPELNYPLPYDIERISLTYKQYDAKVSDLAKGKYVSDWDRWQRTQASLLDQFPDKSQSLPKDDQEHNEDRSGGETAAAAAAAEEEEDDDNDDDDDDETRIALQAVVDTCGNALFRRFTDVSERCRLGALKCVQLLCLAGLDIGRHIAYLMSAIFSGQVQTYYDEELKVFVSDMESHSFYKRGGATIRQDRANLLSGEISLEIKESSEEVRLGICELLQCILRSCVHLNVMTLLDAYFADIILLLQSYLKDPFPDLKVAACHLLCQIVRMPFWESGAKYFATALSRAVIPNLRHRSSKVRIASIHLFESTVSVPDREKVRGAGTEAIVDLVGFQEENILPIAAFYKSECGISVNCLAELISDDNVNVRRRCCEMMSFFCCTLPDRYDLHLRIIPYIIAALTDENQSIQEIALRTIDVCGQQYEAENPNDIIERRQYGVDGDERCNHVDKLPLPFTSRPRIGARLFVRGNSKRFFAALLNELCHWKPCTSLRSAKLIHIIAIYCEEHLTMDFQNTLSGIVKALLRCLRNTGDKELEHLQNTLEKLLITIGRYVDPDTYVKLLLPRIVGDAESGTTFSEGGIHSDLSRSVNALVLRCLIQGTLPRRVLSYLFNMIPDLSSANILSCYANPRVKIECLTTLKALFDRVKHNSIAGAQTAHFEATGRLNSSKQIIMDCKATLEDLMVTESDTTIIQCSAEIIKCIPKDFMEHDICQAC